MSRYAKDRTRDSGLKPVKSVELDDSHVGRRLLIAAALLAVGTIFIAIAITQCNAASVGWTVVEPNKADTDSAGEFSLLYELGAGGVDATSERKTLTVAYSEALEHAGRLFSSLVEYDGVVNLAYLCAHPNETLTVDAELYAALELLESHGDRSIYLAPLFDDYQSIFMANDDSEVGYFDPLTNADVRAFFDEVLAFVQDPAHIDLRLLGSNQVRLQMSAEYLAYCERMEITHVLDLGWLKNAFIADAVADALQAAGYTHGCLTSWDGFARNMDARSDATYALDVWDRVGSVVYQAAVCEYAAQARSLVALRTYGLGSTYDRQHYYETAGGMLYFPYLDTADGLCRAAISDLVAYTQSESCAELALTLAPLYIADELDADALDALSAQGVFTIRCENSVIYSNGTMAFAAVADGYSVVQI